MNDYLLIEITKNEICYIFRVQKNSGGVVDEVVKDNCYCVEDIPECSYVVDIGANVGTFSILCAKERKCNVIAFEPNLKNFSILKENILLNGVIGRVIPVHAAVSSEWGINEFLSRTDHPAGSMFEYLFPMEQNKIGEIEFIPCVSLNFLKWHTFVLKMDCEGSEVDILKHRQPWIDKVSQVVMEWHNHDGYVYKDMLEEDGFEVELCGGGPPPRPEYDKSIGGGLLYAKRAK